jgi:UMF1 family MFS transporter
MTSIARQGISTRRERWAWYLYDFGNSAYASVVLLAVYAAYFQGEVVGGAEGTRLWGIAVGIAMLIVAISAPVLGAIADFSGSKKRLLLFFTVISCTFTALLFFVQKGQVVLGMVLFILAEIGYRSAQVFYNALLPEIAAPEEMGRVSGTGWAIGSVGGIVVLLIILPLIVLIEGTLIVRSTMLITAAFFAVSAIPLFRRVQERAKPQALPPGESYLTIGFKRLWRTFRQARNFREFIKFFISFLVYNDGVIMTLDFAAIIGAVLFGMDQQSLIIFMIMVQATNVIGAFVLGLLADRMSCKQALLVSLLIMVGAVVWLYFTSAVFTFYLIGAVAGFAMAGLQSLSRTMVGAITPVSQSAEFFGFFSVAGRTSSFIGPTIYGWVAAEAALWHEGRGLAKDLAEQSGQRIAILTIGVFLLAGMAILLTVNEKKARAAARAANEQAAAAGGRIHR